MNTSVANKKYALTSEMHLLSCENGGVSGHLAYFPLKSLVLNVNQAAAHIMEQLQKGSLGTVNQHTIEFLDQLVGIGVVNGKPDIYPSIAPRDVPKPTRGMLLISDRCNLRCVYCYNNAERGGDIMPIDVSRAAVDELIRNASDDNRGFIDITFHGGGEPTMNWEVLVRTVEYARTTVAKHGLRSKFSICTNAAFPHERAGELASFIDSITVSIDGPPEIQNLQRPLAGGGPSYDHVAENIDRLSAKGSGLVFRVTATEYSEGRLSDIYGFLIERFRPKTICVEPLFVCGRCATTNCRPPSVESFVRDIIETMRLAPKKKVPIQYSGGKLSSLDDAFCGASGRNFIVTPRGEVTSCVEVSKRTDPRAAIFMYGSYDADRRAYIFDVEKYRRLGKIRVEEFESCTGCFARWHCAGDCPAKAPDMAKLGIENNKYRCRINRDVVRYQLIAEAEREDPSWGKTQP